MFLFVKDHQPVGLPRYIASNFPGPNCCSIDNIGPSIDTVSGSSSEEDEWVCIPVGMDSCASLSVSPPGVFPGLVVFTPQVGEEYCSSSGDVFTSQGHLIVEGFTSEFLPTGGTFQVCGVHRPLIVVSEAKWKGNAFFPRWGEARSGI